MIVHNDFDARENKKLEGKLPEKVESISISHDGGRIEIVVNGNLMYSAMLGTRDCEISIDRK